MELYKFRQSKRKFVPGAQRHVRLTRYDAAPSTSVRIVPEAISSLPSEPEKAMEALVWAFAHSPTAESVNLSQAMESFMEDNDDNEDKDKSIIDRLMDVATTAVGEMAKAALPIGQMTNGQSLVGDASIAPEAIPAPTGKPARKKRSAESYRANRRVAAARARSAKALARETARKKVAKKAVKKKAEKKSAPKKTVKKAAKQSKSSKSPEKTKSPRKKAAKKEKSAAPKKSTKKSKRSKR
jgi:hypothetical protein